MKIDKVLLCTDSNVNYHGYWNTVSKIWKNIFEIQPVLIFVGSKEEFEKCSFDVEEYIIFPKIKNVQTWHVTWSLFYATKHYKDQVCMISGIDQIPLSDYFFEQISYISEDKYIVGLSDCYANYNTSTIGYFNTKSNVMYPSSHHVAKGSLFCDIYDFEEKWEYEIQKLDILKHNYSFANNKNYWGVDECYSSDKISEYSPDKIELKEFAKSWFIKNRIYLTKGEKTRFSKENILSQHYSEVTYKTCNDFNSEIEEIVNLLQENKHIFRRKNASGC